MYPRDIRVNNPTEALIVEKALAMARELNQTACDAPDGKVLAQAETLAVQRGRELTRTSLEAILQNQAQEAEKKGHRPGPARVADRKSTADGESERS